MIEVIKQVLNIMNIFNKDQANYKKLLSGALKSNLVFKIEENL